MLIMDIVCFFFFKQKTADVMRISDWSSDVCSSDLVLLSIFGTLLTDNLVDNFGVTLQTTTTLFSVALIATFVCWYVSEKTLSRSEERRVGKECVRTGRSRWSTYH